MQSDQRRAVRGARADVLDAGLSSRLGAKAAWHESVEEQGAGMRRRGYYLLRLTGRLSLVCVCFFLLQPVRLYWWCPRLPTGGRTPPLPTELYVPPWLWLWEPFMDSFMPLCCWRDREGQQRGRLPWRPQTPLPWGPVRASEPPRPRAASPPSAPETRPVGSEGHAKHTKAAGDCHVVVLSPLTCSVHVTGSRKERRESHAYMSQ